MKKNTYYIYYPRDFANEYTLLYVENAADRAALPENAMRISCTAALKLCREEHDRILHDPACSGFASNTILPAAYNPKRDLPLERNPLYVRVGYMWRRAESLRQREEKWYNPRENRLYICRRGA